jgi:hypothetical protein
MYLFAVTHTPRIGSERELAVLKREIAEVESGATGIEVVAYQRVFGAPLAGTTLYAAVESYAALGEALEKVGRDSRYRDLMERVGTAASGPGDARFMEIPAGPAPAFLDVLTVDTGLAKLSRMDDAMAFAMTMAGIISQKSGQHTVFAADMYGPLGSVAWITPADSYAQLDTQASAIMGDEQYKKLMSESPALFEAALFNRFLDQRIS